MRVKKRITGVLLLAALLLVHTACTGGGQDRQGEIVFTLNYPGDMQALGFTSPVTLSAVPQRVAVMSIGPVLALYRLGVGIVAVPQTSVVDWPEALDSAQRFTTAMADTFDVEGVVALNPDLVIMPFTLAASHGATLESLGLPVYYVMAGHVVPYESIRLQTAALVEAFSNDDNAAARISLDRTFSELNERRAAMRARTAGLRVMVLQSSPPNHYMQTNGALLGNMLYLLGFTNVSTQQAGAMMLMDMESALYYDPDFVFSVGSSASAAEHQALMEADFARNPAYWNSFRAIREGNIVYLPSSFISSAGIAIVDVFHELIYLLNDLL